MVIINNINENINLRKLTVSAPYFIVAVTKQYELTAHNIAAHKADISPVKLIYISLLVSKYKLMNMYTMYYKNIYGTIFSVFFVINTTKLVGIIWLDFQKDWSTP